MGLLPEYKNVLLPYAVLATVGSAAGQVDTGFVEQVPVEAMQVPLA
jgi:hypothetical protein